MRLENVIHLVTAHCEGIACDVVVGGMPRIPGASVLAKKRYFEQHLDGLRTMLVHEPRGTEVQCVNVLVPSEHPDAEFGVLILEKDGLVDMSGGNIISVATVLVETGLVERHEPLTEFSLETAAGLIGLRCRVQDGKVLIVEQSPRVHDHAADDSHWRQQIEQLLSRPRTKIGFEGVPHRFGVLAPPTFGSEPVVAGFEFDFEHTDDRFPRLIGRDVEAHPAIGTFEQHVGAALLSLRSAAGVTPLEDRGPKHVNQRFHAGGFDELPTARLIALLEGGKGADEPEQRSNHLRLDPRFTQRHTVRVSVDARHPGERADDEVAGLVLRPWPIEPERCDRNMNEGGICARTVAEPGGRVVIDQHIGPSNQGFEAHRGVRNMLTAIEPESIAVVGSRSPANPHNGGAKLGEKPPEVAASNVPGVLDHRNAREGRAARHSFVAPFGIPCSRCSSAR